MGVFNKISMTQQGKENYPQFDTRSPVQFFKEICLPWPADNIENGLVWRSHGAKHRAVRTLQHTLLSRALHIDTTQAQKLPHASVSSLVK